MDKYQSLAEYQTLLEIPDSPLCKDINEYIRDCHGDLLFYHSRRVYVWGVMHGKRLGIDSDRELLFAAAMFHDLGLTDMFHSSMQRFELDGADAARQFLAARDIDVDKCHEVWLAIALHTTPEVPRKMGGTIAMLTAGVEMDNMGVDYYQIDSELIAQVVAQFPRPDYKNQIINAFAQGNYHRPASTIGTVNRDVLEYKDPVKYPRVNYVAQILHCPWSE